MSIYKGKPGDMNLTMIKELAGGHTLWRCRNAVGVPYSMIVDADGFEIMSIETSRETEMIYTYLHRNLN